MEVKGENQKIGIRKAAVIQIVSKYLSIAVQLIVTMVLARILTPTEYGTMAIVSVFLGFFSTLSSLGIGSAIIQYGELTKEDCSALTFFTFIIGISVSAAFCIISFPVSWIYEDSALVPLMCMSSLGILFHSLNMVPNGLLAREKRFLVIGARLIITSLVTGVISIMAAIAGFKVYALVINTVLQSLLNTTWNLIATGLKLQPTDFSKQLKLVGRFSVFQGISQVTQYIVRNLDNMLVGRAFGQTLLGLYSKAYSLSRYPADMIPGTLTPVLKSYFANKEDNLEGFFNLYYRIEKVLSISGCLISIICVISSHEIVLLAFGSQWTDAEIPFRYMSLSTMFQMTNFTVFAVLEGLKRTDYLMRHTLISSAIMIILLVAGLKLGNINSVAALVSLALVLYTIPKLYYVVKKGFGRRVISYVIKFIPECCCAIAAGVMACVVAKLVPDILIAQFAVKMMVCLTVYLLLAYMTGQLRYLVSILPTRLRSKLQKT